MAWTVSFNLRILLMLMHSACCISTVTSIALSMMTFKVKKLFLLFCCLHAGEIIFPMLLEDVSMGSRLALGFLSMAFWWAVFDLNLSSLIYFPSHALFRCSLFRVFLVVQCVLSSRINDLLQIFGQMSSFEPGLHFPQVLIFIVVVLSFQLQLPFICAAELSW